MLRTRDRVLSAIASDFKSGALSNSTNHYVTDTIPRTSTPSLPPGSSPGTAAATSPSAPPPRDQVVPSPVACSLSPRAHPFAPPTQGKAVPLPVATPLSPHAHPFTTPRTSTPPLPPGSSHGTAAAASPSAPPPRDQVVPLPVACSLSPHAHPFAPPTQGMALPSPVATPLSPHAHPFSIVLWALIRPAEPPYATQSRLPLRPRLSPTPPDAVHCATAGSPPPSLATAQCAPPRAVPCSATGSTPPPLAPRATPASCVHSVPLRSCCRRPLCGAVRCPRSLCVSWAQPLVCGTHTVPRRCSSRPAPQRAARRAWPPGALAGNQHDRYPRLPRLRTPRPCTTTATPPPHPPWSTPQQPASQHSSPAASVHRLLQRRVLHLPHPQGVLHLVRHHHVPCRRRLRRCRHLHHLQRLQADGCTLRNVVGRHRLRVVRPPSRPRPPARRCRHRPSPSAHTHLRTSPSRVSVSKCVSLSTVRRRA